MKPEKLSFSTEKSIMPYYINSKGTLAVMILYKEGITLGNDDKVLLDKIDYDWILSRAKGENTDFPIGGKVMAKKRNWRWVQRIYDGDGKCSSLERKIVWHNYGVPDPMIDLSIPHDETPSIKFKHIIPCVLFDERGPNKWVGTVF